MDPYSTAPALTDKPVLLFLANMDSTVPAECGRLLWDRLGRPERYNFSLGHRLLFYTLGGQSRTIANWLDRTMVSSGVAARSVAQHGADRRDPSARHQAV